MKPCCGLSNLTGTIIIGILQVILCSILCSAYAMGLAFVNLGREQMLKELDSEAGKDFVDSLGLDNPNETIVFVTIVLYMVVYSLKILFAIQLLVSIHLDSRPGIKIWLTLEVITFVTRLILFVTSLVLITFTNGTGIIYAFSFILEIYCIWIVFLVILDMAKPNWKNQGSQYSQYPEGLRMHSRRHYRAPKKGTI